MGRGRTAPRRHSGPVLRLADGWHLAQLRRYHGLVEAPAISGESCGEAREFEAREFEAREIEAWEIEARVQLAGACLSRGGAQDEASLRVREDPSQADARRARDTLLVSDQG